MVRPVLEYAACAWDPYHADHITRLEAVQRKAARFVTKQHRRDTSVTQLLEHLQWRSLQERRLQARLAMFYKIIHEQASCIIPPQYQRLNSSSRESHPLQFSAPRNRVDSFQYSYFPRTTKVWNILPQDAVQAQDVAQFKAILQQNFNSGSMYVIPPKSKTDRPRLGSTSRVTRVGPVY